MSTDKASPKTSELPDSMLCAHEGIERKNTFEKVSVSFVTGCGRSDALPPTPILSATLSAPLQKPFKEHSLWRVKRLGDFRREQSRNYRGCLLEEGLCPQTSLPGVSRVKMPLRYLSITRPAYTAGCVMLPTLNLVRRLLG